ncbi:glycosyltransferase [Pantoea dispersa]|uniref:glycosyltransferase family A protein n=1 Tax=Pantoea dispersa TaxID=59814 RepID=UPI001BA6C3E2|nr:glycosyltransferase family 2 protein [Pantoea dispersa]MBS0906680.1 glycosyltransferase [Pantoea dispersa]
MAESISPFVSVITVISTDLFLFEETFNSLRTQSFSNWEQVLVCKDSDEENLRTFMRKLHEDDISKIKIISSINLDSYASALNIGLRRSDGEYILILDQHDKISSSYFEMLYKGSRNYQKKIYYADLIINYHATFLNRPFLLGCKAHPSNDDFLSTCSLLMRPSICSLPFSLPREVLTEIGYLKEDCDFPLWDYLARLSYILSFYKLESVYYDMVISDQNIHPRIINCKGNKHINFRYELINTLKGLNDLNLSSEVILKGNEVVLDEKKRYFNFYERNYNRFFTSLFRKSLKLFLLVFRRNFKNLGANK